MSAWKLVPNASGAGSLVLSAHAAAADRTYTLPDRSGALSVEGPSFSATSSAGQALSSGAWNLIQSPVEELDSHGRYNNTGATVGGIPAWSFMPDVAGWYLMVAETWEGTATANIVTAIYKNGNGERYGSYTASGYASNVACLVYLNGTTDYAQHYCYISPAATTTAGKQSVYFQGFLVRPA